MPTQRFDELLNGMFGLKGNAVKFGNSSRCCEFRFLRETDVLKFTPLARCIAGKALEQEQVRRPAGAILGFTPAVNGCQYT